jgi:single-stranded-DNA-specific exonuclease
MQKRWQYKPTPPVEELESLSKAINVNPYLASVLWQRDIRDFETAKDFFRPSLDHLHDPFLLTDMHEAVQRLKQAIDKQEKILIYGDYDVDGTTAVALVYSYLKGFYHNCDFYIPDRYAEGYGVSEAGIIWPKKTTSHSSLHSIWASKHQTW